MIIWISIYLVSDVQFQIPSGFVWLELNNHNHQKSVCTKFHKDIKLYGSINVAISAYTFYFYRSY